MANKNKNEIPKFMLKNNGVDSSKANAYSAQKFAENFVKGFPGYRPAVVTKDDSGNVVQYSGWSPEAKEQQEYNKRVDAEREDAEKNAKPIEWKSEEEKNNAVNAAMALFKLASDNVKKDNLTTFEVNSRLENAEEQWTDDKLGHILPYSSEQEFVNDKNTLSVKLQELWRKQYDGTATDDDYLATAKYSKAIKAHQQELKARQQKLKNAFDKVESFRKERENYFDALRSGRNPLRNGVYEWEADAITSDDGKIRYQNQVRTEFDNLWGKISGGTATDDDYRRYVTLEANYGVGLQKGFNALLDKSPDYHVSSVVDSWDKYGVPESEIWKDEEAYKADADEFGKVYNEALEKYVKGELSEAELTALGEEYKQFKAKEEVFFSPRWQNVGTTKDTETLKLERDNAAKAIDEAPKVFVADKAGEHSFLGGHFETDDKYQKPYDEASARYQAAFDYDQLEKEAKESQKKIDEYKKSGFKLEPGDLWGLDTDYSGENLPTITPNRAKYSNVDEYLNALYLTQYTDINTPGAYELMTIADYGTDEEKATYVWLRETKGASEADKYAKGLAFTIGKRAAAKSAEEYKNASNFERFFMGAGSAIVAGLFGDNRYALEGIVKTVTRDTSYTPANVYQQVNAGHMSAEDNGIAKTAMQAVRSSSAQLPSTAAGLVGAGKIATALFTARAYGSARNDAINQGYGELEADGYALVSAGLEYASERMFDVAGIYGGTSLDDAVKASISKTIGNSVKLGSKTKTVLSTLAYLGLNGAGESIEEGIVEYATPHVRNLILGERNAVNLGEIGNAMLVGLVSAYISPASIAVVSDARANTAVWNVINGNNVTESQLDQIINNKDARSAFEKYMGYKLAANSDIAKAELKAVNSAVAGVRGKDGVGSYNYLDGFNISADSVMEYTEAVSDLLPDYDAEYVKAESERINEVLKEITIDKLAAARVIDGTASSADVNSVAKSAEAKAYFAVQTGIQLSDVPSEARNQIREYINSRSVVDETVDKTVDKTENAVDTTGMTPSEAITAVAESAADDTVQAVEAEANGRSAVFTAPATVSGDVSRVAVATPTTDKTVNAVNAVQDALDVSSVVDSADGKAVTVGANDVLRLSADGKADAFAVGNNLTAVLSSGDYDGYTISNANDGTVIGIANSNKAVATADEGPTDVQVANDSPAVSINDDIASDEELADYAVSDEQAGIEDTVANDERIAELRSEDTARETEIENAEGDDKLSADEVRNIVDNSLVISGKKYTDVKNDSRVKTVGAKRMRLYNAIGRTLGVNVAVFDGVKLYGGKGGTEGMYNPATRTVYLNSTGANKPLDLVFRHEVIHYLELNSPKAFAKFADMVITRYKAMYDSQGLDGEAEYKKWLDDKKAEYANMGSVLKDKEVISEFLAQHGMDMLQNVATVRQMVREDASTMAKVRDAISTVLNKIRRFLGQDEVLTGYGVTRAFAELGGYVETTVEGTARAWDNRDYNTGKSLELLPEGLDYSSMVEAEKNLLQVFKEVAEVNKVVEQKLKKDGTKAEIGSDERTRAVNEAWSEVTGVEADGKVRFSGESDSKFSLAKPVEQTKDLIAVHNLNSPKLRKALELGGFPMPSIAVTRANMGHDKFGDITLVFGRDTIDPAVNSDNKLYGGDAYTPTFPAVRYEADEGKAERISNLYHNLRKKFGADDARPLYNFSDTDNLNDALNRYGGESGLVDSLKDDTDLMQLYIEMKGESKVEPVVVETEEFMSEDDIYKSEFLIEVLGEEFVKGVKRPKGSIAIGHARNYFNKNKDVIKDAVRRMYKEAYGYSDAKTKEIMSGLKDVFYLNLLRKANDYLGNGGKALYETTDRIATNEAIKDKAEKLGYSAWLENTFKGIEGKKGIRNDKDPFTPSGKRRSFEDLHFDYTLDNIVRAMKQKNDKGISIFGGSIVGASAKNYKSVDAMKADSARLKHISQDEYDDTQRGFRNRFRELAVRLANGNDSIDAGNLMAEAVAKYNTPSAIKNYIARESKGIYNYNDDIGNELLDIVNGIANMPTGYFEAKPKRAVGFDEVKFAVVPESIDADLRNGLEAVGTKVVTYKDGDSADRLEKLNSDSGVKFSKAKVDSDNVGYHAGDLGKAESLGSQSRDRSTGHFGRGTYFVGDLEKIKHYNRRDGVDAPKHAVDFSDYNLYKIKNDDDGYKLHNQLRILDGGIKEDWINAAADRQFRLHSPLDAYKYAEEKYGEDHYSNEARIYGLKELAKKANIDIQTAEEFSKESGYDLSDEYFESAYIEYLDEKIDEELDAMNDEYREFFDAYDWLEMRFGSNKVKQAMWKTLMYQNANAGNTMDAYKKDSLATVFMKALGYEGVDTRGTSLDNTEYGSVIYDIKKDTVKFSKSPITPAKEAEYLELAKNPEKNDAKLSQMVGEAAEESGFIVDAYHGTSKGGFTWFDTYAYYSKFGLFGNGAYFTEDENIAEQYTKKGKGNNPQVYHVRLNISNPIDMDAKADIDAWNKALQKTGEDFSILEGDMSNEQAFKRMVEDLEYNEVYSYDAAEIVRNVFEDMGYNGITHIGGGRANQSDGTRHRVWIAFEPEQIKSADPVTYDDDGNIIPLSERFNDKKTDIRWSKSAPDSSDTAYIFKGEKPARDINVPAFDDKGKPVSFGARTVLEAKVTPDKFVSHIMEDVVKGKYSHEVITDEDALAYVDDYLNKHSYEEAYDRIVSTKGVLSKEDTVLAMHLYNGAINNVDFLNQLDGDGVARIDKLVSKMVTSASEAGRSLQAQRLLKKMTPQGMLWDITNTVQAITLDMERQLGKYVETSNGEIFEGKRVKTKADIDSTSEKNYKNFLSKVKEPKKWSEKQKPLKINPELRTKLLKAANNTEANKVYDEILDDLASQIVATIPDKLRSWRYMAMLTNPRTHVRNIIGNAMFAVGINTRNLLSSVIEPAVVKKEDRRNTLVMTPERRRTQNALKTYADSLFKTYESNIKGESRYSDSIPGMLDDRRRIFQSKVLGDALEFVRKKNSDLLEKEDMWFLKGRFTKTFANAALARGYTVEDITSGKVSKSAVESLIRYATLEAQKATYRDASKLADMLNKISREHAAAGFVLNSVVPFKKTPVNIVKRAVEYSPVSIIKGIVKLGKQTIDYKTGKSDYIDSADIVQMFSQGTTGTGLLAIGMWLAAQGLLKGGDDDEDKLNDLKAARGEQNYSIEIGGYSFTIDWAAPLAMPLFMGAELINMSEGKFETTELFSAVFGIATPVLDMSMMSGVMDFLDTIKYSEGSDLIPDIVTSVASGYALQFVPSVTAATGRTIDEVDSRTSVTEKKGDVGVVDRFINKLANKSIIVRGLWKNKGGYNAPYTDMFGNYKKKETAGDYAMSFLHNFILPGYISEVTDTPTTKHMMELFESTDSLDFVPGYVNKITVDGESRKLTGKEIFEYQKLRGEHYHDIMPELVGSEWYNSLDDEKKVAVLTGFKELVEADCKHMIDENYFPNNARQTHVIKLGFHNEDVMSYLQGELVNELAVDDKNVTKYKIMLDLDISDEAKTNLHFDMFGDTELKEQNKVWAFEDAGLTINDYLEARIKKAEIDDTEGITAGEKASEFHSWAREEYGDKKADVIYKTLPEFTGHKIELADVAAYKYANIGLSEKDTGTVLDALSKLEPEDGKTQVSDLQKAEAIVNSGIPEKEQAKALANIYKNSSLERFNVAYANGISPKLYVEFQNKAKEIDESGKYGSANGSVDSEELLAAVDAVKCSDKEKAVLYQTYSKSTNPASNPYDVDAAYKLVIDNGWDMDNSKEIRDIISNNNMDDTKKLTKLQPLMESEMYEAVKGAGDKGISVKITFDILQNYDRNYDTYSYMSDAEKDTEKGEAEKSGLGIKQYYGKKAVDSIPGLNNVQKAILWQSCDPFWSHKNNPYSTQIGESYRAEMGWDKKK